MKIYPITPVAKPRQTRRDKWAKRPAVVRYRNYADECRAAGIVIEDVLDVTFELPMPDSWSQKKKANHDGEPHRQKPDIDNLLKGLMDAVLEDDSGVHNVSAKKVWGEVGRILIF